MISSVTVTSGMIIWVQVFFAISNLKCLLSSGDVDIPKNQKRESFFHHCLIRLHYHLSSLSFSCSLNLSLFHPHSLFVMHTPQNYPFLLPPFVWCLFAFFCSLSLSGLAKPDFSFHSFIFRRCEEDRKLLPEDLMEVLVEPISDHRDV